MLTATILAIFWVPLFFATVSSMGGNHADLQLMQVGIEQDASRDMAAALARRGHQVQVACDLTRYGLLDLFNQLGGDGADAAQGPGRGDWTHACQTGDFVEGRAA